MRRKDIKAGDYVYIKKGRGYQSSRVRVVTGLTKSSSGLTGKAVLDDTIKINISSLSKRDCNTMVCGDCIYHKRAK